MEGGQLKAEGKILMKFSVSNVRAKGWLFLFFLGMHEQREGVSSLWRGEKWREGERKGEKGEASSHFDGK